jgi:hypothetical protein
LELLVNFFFVEFSFLASILLSFFFSLLAITRICSLVSILQRTVVRTKYKSMNIHNLILILFWAYSLMRIMMVWSEVLQPFSQSHQSFSTTYQNFESVHKTNTFLNEL